MATAELSSSRIEELLGDDARDLLQHECTTFPASSLHLPGPDFIERVFLDSDRSTSVLRQLQWLFDTGRAAGTNSYEPSGPPGFATATCGGVPNSGMNFETGSASRMSPLSTSIMIATAVMGFDDEAKPKMASVRIGVRFAMSE